MKRFLSLVAMIAAVLLVGCKPQTHYQMKGVILDPTDLTSVEWVKMAAENGINTIGTHMAPGCKAMCAEISEFILSERGQEFLAECERYGIDVEHQLHAMKELLPRDLFAEDSTMFRMNEEGRRVADVNCCVHSERALGIIVKNAVEIAKVLRPTNHRYYYWLDDGKPVCQCPQCKDFSPSDQALIIENRIIKGLREIDPEAKLAHLAYHNAVQAPRKVKPVDGIFLEFAPYFRSWDHPLTDLEVERRGMTHGENLQCLKDNLEVFDPETAIILEYWLDVSLFSRWKKPAIELPWRRDVFLSDIDTFAKMGIKNVTSFALFMDSEYFSKYSATPVKEYGEGLNSFVLTSER